MTYTSIDSWIDRQTWPDDIKERAHEAHASLIRRNLNPMTGSAWVRWAENNGVIATFGGGS